MLRKSSKSEFRWPEQAMTNFEIQSIPSIAVLCNFWQTETGDQIDLFKNVICTIYTPRTVICCNKLCPVGQFFPTNFRGICRNRLRDMHVTDAPLSNSHSEVPPLVDTFMNGCVWAVCHTAVQHADIIAKTLGHIFILAW